MTQQNEICIVHSVSFCKKRWDFTTSDSFLNFWVFPLLGFLNPKAGFLIFEEIIHWFLKKNIFLLLFSAAIYYIFQSKTGHFTGYMYI